MKRSTNPYNFSKETTKWLGGWLSGGDECEPPSEAIRKELSPYLEDWEFYTLYRGPKPEDVIDETGKIVFEKPSSWTHNIYMAENFAGVDAEGKQIRPIKINVPRESVLIDISQLDKQYVELVLGGFPDEMEVILKEGTYQCFDYDDDYDYY